MWACIVPRMTHDEWIRKHGTLAARVEVVRAQRDELTRHAEHVPGPVLRKRHNELDELEGGLLDELAELVELDRSGAVS